MFNRIFIKYYTDNIELNLGVGGKTIATDDIGGIQHELVKLEYGVDGAATMVSATNPLPTTEAAPTTIFNGKKLTVTAGTRVTLSTTQAIKSVVVTALSTNTGIIYVGNATVASTNGLQLIAGQSVGMDIADLATVNIDSSVSGEGVTYLAVA